MAKYTREVAEDFCKAMEESGIIVKGSHKNKKVIDNFLEIINMTQSQADITITTGMLRHEFGDWIETYTSVA